LDTQKDIERAAETLSKEKGCSMIEALKMLHSRYQSDRRVEEALIVDRLIDRELEKSGERGFRDGS
jgi:AmiR/NasT family two-component response regulator